MSRKFKLGSEPARDRKRSRVTIGPAFDKWRAMKVKYKMKSDKEMAQYLLTMMKRCPPGSASDGPGSVKRRFCKSEVQRLIDREVHKAVTKSKMQLQSLVETVQNMNHEENFENSIQKLQARIDLVSRRTEEALSYLKRTENKSPLPQDAAHRATGDLQVDTTNIFSQKAECEAKREKLIKMVETTHNALKKICNSNQGHEDPPPPVLTPYDCPELKVTNKIIKKEGRKDPEPVPVPSGAPKPEEEDDTESWVVYPPLPTTTFPSVLNIEAASYSIPQRLDVNLALIKNPTRLSVLWNVKEKDPSAPPMESYSIFLTMEKVKGSGIFSGWHRYDRVEAMALPMCALIKKYKRGHKVCAAVLGRDIFGRYGPYSKVVTATIPD